MAWLDHLGTVEVEVELADREVTMEVSPLQASLLCAFEDNGTPFKYPKFTMSDQLNMVELCQMTGTSAISVRRAVTFWVLHGVLKEIAPDTFHVLEYAEETSPKQSSLFNLVSNSSFGDFCCRSPIKCPISCRASRI